MVMESTVITEAHLADVFASALVSERATAFLVELKAYLLPVQLGMHLPALAGF